MYMFKVYIKSSEKAMFGGANAQRGKNLDLRNAIKVYGLMEKWNPRDESELLAAHKIMLSGLVDSPGHYCSGGVGIVGK